jgi:hypothetical protein
MERLTQILAASGSYGRVQQLYAQGYSAAAAAAILAWEQELEIEQRRLADEKQSASKTPSDTYGAHLEEQGSEALSKVLSHDLDVWKVRAEKAEAALARAQLSIEKLKQSGKRFQTLLKIVFLKGVDLGFDPNRPNGAVTAIQDQLADHDIHGADDEAFRDALKTAFDRKSAGHWKPKPHK